MMQGFIEFLLSEDVAAWALRDKYVFKIIPMLNPDGVVYGNYRWSLFGYDLNRRWASPHKQYDPTIYHMKKMMKTMKEEREILVFWDFHGHSCKKNAFMYGWEYEIIKKNWYFDNFILRSLPALFSDWNEHFSLKDCTFKNEK